MSITAIVIAASTGLGDLPEPVATLLEADHVLPRYAERYYHPLGRSPVVDALLADPLYGPAYADAASTDLRAAATTGSVEAVAATAQRLAAVPDVRADEPPAADDVVVNALRRLAVASRMSEAALAPIPEAERDWLRAHPARWFFTDEDRTNLRYLTCDTTDHLRIFVSAAMTDVAALCSAQLVLAGIADDLLAAHAAGRFDTEDDLPRRVELDGLVAVVAGRGDDVHDQAVDLLIDLGGDDWYLGNAGGNEGERAATLCVDLAGDDRYDGGFADQGGGFLGVGALVDAEGDDTYRAGDIAQGAAFLGAGLLCDLGGDDSYSAHHLSQAAAVFGCGVLWDAGGNDTYAASGMAMGAAATLGVAVLVESGGDDRAVCGIWRRERYSIDSGMGLGWSAGLRHWPWTDAPAFYGGLGLVDDAGGTDRYETRGGGLGGAYCLGAGVFTAGGDENDTYYGLTDSLGASIHLGAGICLESGGDDVYRGQDSVLGVGGDRGWGVFIDRAGDDRYDTRNHALGTGRKPRAVGLFIDGAGRDHYGFGADSLTATWRPSSPEKWAFASFLDLDGDDVYAPTSADTSGLDRGNDRTWQFGPTGFGEDLSGGDLEAMLAALPTQPRTTIPWSLAKDAPARNAYRPIIDDSWPGAARAALRDGAVTDADDATRTPAPIDAWLSALMTEADYDERRNLYERLDLLRFASGDRWDWSAIATLLDGAADAPEDRLAFAAVWCTVDRTPGVTARVADDLVGDRIASMYARQLLVRMIGVCADPGAAAALADRLARDPDPLVRARAAWQLAQSGRSEHVPDLAESAAREPALIRAAIASGLRDTSADGSLELALTFAGDADMHVRRKALLAAISMGHKPAVGRLLDEMAIRSIDTGQNYGRNLFADLAEYVGPDVLDRVGLDRDAWASWWREAGGGFDLEASIAASAEYRASRRRPLSSE